MILLYKYPRLILHHLLKFLSKGFRKGIGLVQPLSLKGLNGIGKNFMMSKLIWMIAVLRKILNIVGLFMKKRYICRKKCLTRI